MAKKRSTPKPKAPSSKPKVASSRPAGTGASAQKARAQGRRLRERRRNALLVGAIAAGIAGLITFQVVRQLNLPGERFASQGNRHLTSLSDARVPYNSDPPTSGPHMPGLAPWGVHETPVEDEYLVHNLEDGGVVIYYQMGTPEETAAAIAALRAIAAPYRNVVITPREGMANAYTFTAWQRMQRFDAIEEQGMERFLKAYEGIDHHVPGVG